MTRKETPMNRRTFAQAIATAALAAAVPELPAAPSSQASSPTPAAPPFPLSVMLWTVFTDLPFEERLAKVAAAGYTNIELVGEYNAKKWTDADYARANAAAKRLGIRFDATAGMDHAGHANGIADPAQRDPFLAELKQALAPMETLACPAMIVLSGNAVPGMSREEQHQSCVDTLKRGAELIDGKQIGGQPVRLLLECIHVEESPKCFLTSAAEGIEIVRAVNHPQVQFLYDIYHEQMGFGNLIEKLDKHIDVIGLIHIADVPGRHEPGTGEINYGNIYRKLAQLTYRHNVAMEFRPVGDQVATLRAAKELVWGNTA
jgi:hydroxypyruvate isomerase